MTIKVKGHLINVQGTPVEVVRKDIKNLHVGVYPPSGRVRVAAPVRLDDDAVRLAVISRLGWIRRKQAEFEQQDRQSQREFVTGESHYFEGRRYRIDVTERGDSPTVRLLNNTKMALSVRPGAEPGQAGSCTLSMVSLSTPRAGYRRFSQNGNRRSARGSPRFTSGR